MAHFFDPRTHQKTDFFVLKSCSTIKAALWNVGGPSLYVSSDNANIAAVSAPRQFSDNLYAGTDIFEFFITGTTSGNILIRAKNDRGDQWALSQAVVSAGDLCLDATGSAVKTMQERLNCRKTTRLPRLVANGRFDVLTKARVMEFQAANGLKADGVAGSKTLGALSKGAAACTTGPPPKGRCILVDLIGHTLIAFNNGVEELRSAPVSGGSASDPSTPGVFPMSSRRLRDHTSSKFPIPPGNMNFSLFYHDTQAIHQGPGSVPSHGCIHVSAPNAERLFTWAGTHDVVVIVVKR